MKTPLECLVLLDKQGLVEFKKGNTPHALQARAKVQTDLQAAQAMQKAKVALFFARGNGPRLTRSPALAGRVDASVHFTTAGHLRWPGKGLA